MTRNIGNVIAEWCEPLGTFSMKRDQEATWYVCEIGDSKLEADPSRNLIFVTTPRVDIQIEDIDKITGETHRLIIKKDKTTLSFGQTTEEIEREWEI